jgi:protein gp37
MSNGSRIEWTESTWSPVTGCTRVSEGCRNCYAERLTATRLASQPKYAGLALLDAKREAHWTGEIRLHEAELAVPLKWRRGRMIFVCSMSDLFHEKVPFEFVDKVFAVMALCPQHTFQVLTKRPERMAEYLRLCYIQATQGGRGILSRREDEVADRVVPAWFFIADCWSEDRPLPDPMRPLPNVWLGTSVEDQRTADERIPHLLQCPAAVRFLSCEPLLNSIDLRSIGWERRIAEGGRITTDALAAGGISWVIVGGESGPGARPMHPDWACSLRDQCAAAGVPFFFKQIGEWTWFGKGVERKHWVCEHGHFDELNDDRIAKHRDGDQCMGSTIGIARVGKHAAGRLLDGREHNGMPLTNPRDDEPIDMAAEVGR